MNSLHLPAISCSFIPVGGRVYSELRTRAAGSGNSGHALQVTAAPPLRRDSEE